MSDTDNGGKKSPPKEISMETRMLLAFTLMGIIIFAMQYFTPAAAPVKKGTAPAAQATPAPPGAGQTDQNAVAVPKENPQADAGPPTAPATHANPQPPLTIDTDVFHITFSNQGASVHDWVLKKHKAAGKPLDLVNQNAKVEDPYAFSFYIPQDKQLAQKLDWAWYTQTSDPDGLGVTFDYSDGHTVAHKVFRFEKNSYLVHVSTELNTDGKPVPHMIEWRGGFGDLTVPTASASQRTLNYDLSSNKLTEQAASSAKAGPITNSGNYSFAGLEDTYFTAVFLPENNATMQLVTFCDYLTSKPDEKPLPYVGAAVSMGASNRFELFVGPKDLDLLKRVNPKLEQVVNFGWISILAKPLFLIVNWFNDNVVHNFGWAIVLVTIVINFVLFPLKISNMKSMRKMQALKPQIDAINAKYKNIKMTDPKAADKNQETMDLYKKYGVNPMGGCVPMLIQIPFFFAFYRVFTVSVEMRGAPWLWVSDLSQPETLAIRILPIVMIVSQFYMQSMTPQPAGDPNQQKIMKLMPLFFGIMFYQFASGLVLYYLTSNLVGMGQQWFFNHTATAEEAARSVEPPKKKNGKK